MWKVLGGKDGSRKTIEFQDGVKTRESVLPKTVQDTQVKTERAHQDNSSLPHTILT